MANLPVNNYMNKLRNSHSAVENVCATLLSFIFSFFFSINSSLHIWKRSDIGTDSSVFKTVSLMIRKGYMPYSDSFDHKGPIIYLINLLGDCISEYRGVWVVEVLFLTVAFYMIYKTSRLSCKKLPSLIVTLTSSSLLFLYYQEGNFTEEYAMSFIAISTFIFLDYFKNGIINKRRLLICGATFAATFLLRPNMTALWVVMCIAVLIRTVIKKEPKCLLFFITYFIIGALTITLPLFIWLFFNGALSQCISDFILFNIEYTSASANEGRAVFANKWYAFFFFFNSTVNIIATLSQIYACKNSKSLCDLSYFIYMIISLFFICLSGMTYEHYGMVLIPGFAYPLSNIFLEMSEFHDKKVSNIITFLVIVYALSIIILPDWITLIQKIPSIYESRYNDCISWEVKDIVYEFDNLGLSENDPVSVYGNWNIIYVISKRPHATKYSYQFPIGDIKPEIMDEYIDELELEQPKAIVVQAGKYDERIKTFLEKNDYVFVYGQYGEIDAGGALLFYKEEMEIVK